MRTWLMFNYQWLSMLIAARFAEAMPPTASEGEKKKLPTWAIILIVAVVLLCVIPICLFLLAPVILALLGPSVGNVFSNIIEEL